MKIPMPNLPGLPSMPSGATLAKAGGVATAIGVLGGVSFMNADTSHETSTALGAPNIDQSSAILNGIAGTVALIGAAVVAPSSKLGAGLIGSVALGTFGGLAKDIHES